MKTRKTRDLQRQIFEVFIDCNGEPQRVRFHDRLEADSFANRHTLWGKRAPVARVVIGASENVEFGVAVKG